MSKYELSSKNITEYSHKDKAMYTLAAIAGAMGSVSDGLNISAAGAELLPQLAAVAVPGIAAWVIARSMFNKNKSQSQL